MFSASLAVTTGAMRPGLISGRFPEREDRENDWLEDTFNAMKGKLLRLSIDRQAGLSKAAAAIGRQEDSLKTLSKPQIDKRLAKLRTQFRSQGLSQAPCIHSFAVIREMARRTIQMRHYDSQLMGGWTMLHGQLAEMETGEGKTLAATLAAATVALAGIPVHVITVNEYLVERDAKAMAPLYRALGLTVGYVTQEMDPDQRRSAYACDIAYCTNKQVAFDYLRDRLLIGNNHSRLRLQLKSAYAGAGWRKKFLLRGLCFAIVDEADSVLIDEARTPLILTRTIDRKDEHAAYCHALELAKQMEQGKDFILLPRQGEIQITLDGQQKLDRLRMRGSGLWQNPIWREDLVHQALRALYQLRKDHDYLVKEGKILIIDANTGRTMPDRSWERGLHQMVEAKESCPLSVDREQLARLTYQQFFRRYLKLSGMTGTAREVSAELWTVYGLKVQRVPLHRPCRRREIPACVYGSAKEKWMAITAAVIDITNQGRPVLIGTSSVADSELLSQKLNAKGIAHQVLNARQDKEEAKIIAAAGKQRQVTVATNMAGRGTDIPLGEGVAELGGLHVITASRNDAKRIDRQLSGRCARQGDPGSHQAILSLEDELVVKNGSSFFIPLIKCSRIFGPFPQHRLYLHIIRCAQRKVERRFRNVRRALLKHERQTGRLLAISGRLE